jgi:peptidoglycan/LPS O-acetylase OafA/YrhL
MAFRAAGSAGEGPRVNARLAGIEAGRGIAATAVVLYHAARLLDQNHLPQASLLARVFQFGHAGVDFFFVISGFIILYVHARDIGVPARAAHYVQRRFSRVMPIYWVALLCTIALVLLGRSHPAPGPDAIVWSALLLPSHGQPLLGVAWTLQYEAVFYAVFAVLIVNRVAGAIMFGAWGAWIASGLLMDTSFGLPAALNGVFNIEFFAGMAAAYCLKRYGVRAPLLLLALGIALFALTSSAEDIGAINGYGGAARVLYGAASVCAVLGAVAADLRGRLHVPGLLRSLGAASYSIYLFQFIFIGVIWRGLGAAGLQYRMPAAVTFVMLVLGAVLGGVATSRLIEYPLMQRLRRHRQARQPQPAM